MYSADNIGLACGSLSFANFQQLVEAAASAGFNSVSLRPFHYKNALSDGLSVQDMRQILDDNGIHITELDPYCSWHNAHVDPGNIAAPFFSLTDEDFYEVADNLGARSLNIIQIGGEDISLEQKADLIGELCLRAEKHDLIVTVEFMPWSPISSLKDAIALHDKVASSNFGINIDIWHHFRSGGQISDLTRIAPDKIQNIQFNDVAETPWDNLLEETAQARLCPGEGFSESVKILQTLYNHGVTAPISIEVYSMELMALPFEATARRMATAMQNALNQASELTKS